MDGRSLARKCWLGIAGNDLQIMSIHNDPHPGPEYDPQNWPPDDVLVLRCEGGITIRENVGFEVNLASGTELRVCNDIADRQRKGIAKYGTTVEDNSFSLREWLQHAYEETLDKAVYLKRALEEMDK